MKNDNIKYLIIGFLFALACVIIMSASSDLNSQKGRYEHNIDGATLSILDTHTGVVKIYFYNVKKIIFEHKIDYTKN